MRTERKLHALGYLVVVGLIIVGALKVFDGKLRIVEEFSSCCVYPFLFLQKKIVAPLKGIFDRRRTLQELECTIAWYQQERENLLSENIRLLAGQEELVETTELIDFNKRYTAPYKLVAQIIVKNFSKQGHYFLVDAGGNRGVTPDMIVIYKNFLVGRVTQVFPFYSKVALITDSTCKVAAHCIKSKASGIHTGSTSTAFSNFTYVSHLQTLYNNDIVVSSGEGTIFPKGFGLGKIASYDLDGLYYRVILEPLLDFHALTHCCIIQKGAEYKSEHCC
jgi:rod shape-determining protein MreC